MGTTGCYREPGKTDRQFFEEEFFKPGEQAFVACGGTLGAFYGVVQNGPNCHRPNEVWMLVVKTTRVPRSDFNFYYKEMDESMGPALDTCPAKVLDTLERLVPEPPNEWAAEWRQRCRENLDRRSRAAKVKPGMKVRFAEAISFTDGSEADTFTFVQRSTFKRDYAGRYRITNWRERDFEVVTA